MSPFVLALPQDQTARSFALLTMTRSVCSVFGDDVIVLTGRRQERSVPFNRAFVTLARNALRYPTTMSRSEMF